MQRRVRRRKMCFEESWYESMRLFRFQIPVSDEHDAQVTELQPAQAHGSRQHLALQASEPCQVLLEHVSSKTFDIVRFHGANSAAVALGRSRPEPAFETT